MNTDPYKNFAERYDWMAQKDPVREEFFRRLFEKYHVTDILDCACGTGLDLIMFHSIGCNVTGSDLSDAMLAQAKKNLAAAGIDVPLKKSDFRELERNHSARFDAVVCLTSAINEVLEDEEVQRALQSMKTMLRSGGILVFDQGMTDAMMKNPPKFDPVINDRDCSRLFVLEYTDKIMSVNIFDFLHTDQSCNFYTAKIDLAIRLKDDWDRLLAEVGFFKSDYFGGMDFSEYDKETSSRLIAVSEK